jgi:hypothetical protein
MLSIPTIARSNALEASAWATIGDASMKTLA